MSFVDSAVRAFAAGLSCGEVAALAGPAAATAAATVCAALELRGIFDVNRFRSDLERRLGVS